MWLRVLAMLGLAMLGPGMSALTAHQQLERRVAALSKQIHEQPAQAPLYLSRGELYRVSRDWRAAFADYAAAERLDPELDAVALARARLFLDLERGDRAARSLDDLLAREPRHGPALLLLARALATQGRHDEAARAAEQALRHHRALRPEDVSFAAHCFESSRPPQPARALACLELGLAKLGPCLAVELHALEREQELGRFDDGLKRLDRLQSHARRTENLCLRRGLLLEQAGRPELAEQAFAAGQRALDELPASRRELPLVNQLRRQLVQGRERMQQYSQNRR